MVTSGPAKLALFESFLICETISCTAFLVSVQHCNEITYSEQRGKVRQDQVLVSPFIVQVHLQAGI